MLAIPAPMRATEGGRPFSSPDWLYEIKYDGYRCLARAGGGQPVELRTKSGVDCTRWFPEVAQLLEQLPGGPHVLDGEACVLDDIGRSDFECLQARARRRRWYPGCNPVTLCAFDLLYLDGRNVMGLPLVDRKAALAGLLQPLAPRLVIVGHLPGRCGAVRSHRGGSEARGLRGQAPGQRVPARRDQPRLAQGEAPRLERRPYLAKVALRGRKRLRSRRRSLSAATLRSPRAKRADHGSRQARRSLARRDGDACAAARADRRHALPRARVARAAVSYAGACASEASPEVAAVTCVTTCAVICAKSNAGILRKSFRPLRLPVSGRSLRGRHRAAPFFVKEKSRHAAGSWVTGCRH